MATASKQANQDVEISTAHLWERPGYLVRRLNQIHHALFFECCKAVDITPVQYGLLTTLIDIKGLNQSELCVELGIDRTTMADVLQRLEARGLVKRESDPADKRQKISRITPKGRKLITDSYDSMREAQIRLLAPLPPKSRALFVSLMTELVQGNNEYGRTSVRSFE